MNSKQKCRDVILKNKEKELKEVRWGKGERR
jgi:hypothetical protein